MPIDRSEWLPRAGDRFSFLRDVRGVTVQQLAASSGVSERTIYYLEAGRHMPSVSICQKLEGPLGVSNLASALIKEYR